MTCQLLLHNSFKKLCWAFFQSGVDAARMNAWLMSQQSEKKLTVYFHKSTRKNTNQMKQFFAFVHATKGRIYCFQ